MVAAVLKEEEIVMGAEMIVAEEVVELVETEAAAVAAEVEMEFHNAMEIGHVAVAQTKILRGEMNVTDVKHLKVRVVILEQEEAAVVVAAAIVEAEVVLTIVVAEVTSMEAGGITEMIMEVIAEEVVVALEETEGTKGQHEEGKYFLFVSF